MTTSRPLTSRDPERIGGHHLLGRLGEGGQGVVYLAEDESGARVALKVLHDRGGSRDTFLKEISAARKVASFCTAEILHVDEDEDLPYVVTEFIDGPSLRELVEEKGPQSGPALYRLAIGTATALAAIHQAGIVHRDFKPGNVLVGPDGPRVIDFGVARSMDATVTAASTVIGTPSYMAPEQLAGEVVGPAADVFAWGATIAYAANGRPPYGQDTIPAVMNRIITGKPDLGGLAGPLRELVTQALHKDAAKRPHSRDILLRLLEHSQGPISAPEALAQGRALAMADDDSLADERTARWATVKLPTATTPAKRPMFQRAALVTGVLAALVLLAGTMAIAVTGDSREPRRTAAASPTTPGTTPRQTSQHHLTPTQQTPAGAPSTDVPATPSAVATDVQAAVARRGTATFSVEGGMTQSADSFKAQGRLHYQPGRSTNYDLTLSTDLEAASYDGSAGPRIILLGECGYYRDDPTSCHPTDAESQREINDAFIWTASEVRWVTSPYNIGELLQKSTSLRHNSDAGTITYRGTAVGADLAADGPISPFYQMFGGGLTKVTYTLVINRAHLPERLDIDLWSKITPDLTYHSLYSATYRDWGSSGTITRPY
ncbi:serine/threonine protein kinase [Actinomadura formosensis]|uniref:serine/threonine protein kinase n=1 Tax=Actinomadura formosensis TaxID=60706 RepID=UPI0008349B62|nr:serine/threonine protein kinase [Actinomadura formosensis]